MGREVAVCGNGHYLGRQSLLAESEKFCPSCGSKIFRECPNCGEPIRVNEFLFDATYCSSCGALYPWLESEEDQPPRQFYFAMENENESIEVTLDGSQIAQALKQYGKE